MDRNTWIGLTVAALCLAFVLSNSGSGKNTEVETLLASTMAVHDSAMVDMGAMNRAGRALKRELTTLDSLAPRADSIRHVLREIKKAEDDMFAWMRAYEAPKADTPAEEALLYLQGQHAAISRNHHDIRAATETGQKLQQKQ